MRHIAGASKVRGPQLLLPQPTQLSLLRPLHYQRRLQRRGLRLLDILVKPTSAFFTPENHLVGVIERPLGPRRRICQVQGAGTGHRSPELWGWRSVERGEPTWRPWCPGECGGEELVALPRGWRELASRRPRVRWRLVWVMVWCSFSVSSPEPASGGSPRLESRDLERALSVS